MDKALELIMVASILIVASVVVLALLQNQSEGYGDFSRNRTDTGNCELGRLKYERALNCGSGSGNTETTTAQNVRTANSGCAWTSEASSNPSNFC